MSDAFSAADLIKQALRLGVAIVVPLVILLLAGRTLDIRFDTTPLFLIVGLVLSFVVSIVTLVKIVRRSNTNG